MCRSVIQIEAKLELGRIRHAAGMPWGIEHDFNMNFLDTGNCESLLSTSAVSTLPIPHPGAVMDILV